MAGKAEDKKKAAPKEKSGQTSTPTKQQDVKQKGADADETKSEQPKRKPPKLGPRNSSSQSQVSKAPDESGDADEAKSEQPKRKPPKLGPRKSSSQSQVSKAPDESGDGQDLTTVLDESQRAEFTLLIANATESMRKLIVDIFSSTAGLNKALLRENMSEDEKLMSAEIDPDAANVEALDRERKLKAQLDKELSTEKATTLKKDALKAFDEWREAVIERVGKVVNSERNAKGQNKDASADTPLPQAPDLNPIGTVTEKPGTEQVKLKFKDLYPPTKTSLTRMNMQQRTLVLHSLLLLLLSLEHYNAPSRVLLLHVTSSLKLPLKVFEQDEATVAKGLLESAKELTADEETKKKAEANKESRKWKVNLATAAGVAVIGYSGGMAAPLISAGVGTIMGSLGLGATAAAGYLGSVAGSTVLVGGLFGAYGGRMTGQMMDKYAREVEDFQFLPVHSRNKTSEDAKEGAQQATQHNHKLRVTICISGWLTEKDEVVRPWKVIGRGAEVFALKWELEALLNLGNAMDGLVQSAAWGYAQKQLIQKTVFADLMAAMWPVGLIKAAGVIDNPFSVAKDRADKAGEVLADALINRAQGERPVTLIGYSLGARLIFSCLTSLAKRKAFGLVESAVLIGAPTPSNTADWRLMRTAATARLINVYSENDYVLGFMYRTSSIQYGVAGLQKISGLAGVENVDVSEDVKGHLRYRYLIGSILNKIGFGDIDLEAVKEEQIALHKMEEEEKKNSLRAQKNRLIRRESTGGKEDEAKEAQEEADQISKDVAAKTQKSLVTRAVEYFYAPKKPSGKDVERNLSLLQQAAADPGEAGAVAMEAIRDIQASGMSYAQWAAQKLPNIRGGGEQSYTQAAASYLPSLRSKKGPAQKVGDAAKEVEGAVDKTPVAGTVKDVVKPTVTNTLDKAGTAASTGQNAAEGAIDKTPAKGVKDAAKTTVGNAGQTAQKGAGQVTDKGQEVVGGTSAAAQTYTQRAAGYLPSFGGSPKGTKEPAKAAEKTADSAQSYTSKAAGYVPGLGGQAAKPAKGKEESSKSKPEPATPQKSWASTATGYIPSVPGLGRSPDTTPKKAPKLARNPSSTPKAGNTPESKPALDRVGSGAKKSVPKLDRKLPVSALERTGSGVKKAIPKLGPKTSESKGADPTGGTAGQVAEGVKGGVGKGQEAAAGGVDAAKTGVESGTGVLTDGAGKGAGAAKSGAESGAGVVKDGAGKGVGAAKTGVESGAGAVKDGAGKGQEAVTGGVAQGQKAVTGGVAKGQEGIKKGIGGLGGMLGGK